MTHLPKLDVKLFILKVLFPHGLLGMSVSVSYSHKLARLIRKVKIAKFGFFLALTPNSLELNDSLKCSEVLVTVLTFTDSRRYHDLSHETDVEEHGSLAYRFILNI